MSRTRPMALAIVLAAAAAAVFGWTPEAPADYGRITLDNFSTKAGMAKVQFDHWRHRARYTCRLCHVDVGFAMRAGETRVSAETNRSGFHCGACHDGKRTLAGRPIFPSCGEKPSSGTDPACSRCHTRGDAAQRKKDFDAFAADLPRKGAAGNIDWEAAEAKGYVRPADEVEGISIPRPPLTMDKDITIESRAWMTDVLFSHRKHATWNGCEVCHPDIYPHGATARRVTMLQISAGESCGVCHRRVAFSIGDCERCHVNPVR